MISQSKNRVQAIKSKFENLNVDIEPLVLKKRNTHVLQQCKQNVDIAGNNNKENNRLSYKDNSENDSSDECVPNVSYLYSDSKKNDLKKALTRQTSDPGKKLHRSHAFRCDRNQKIGHSPKRHGSCYGRSETSDFTLKMGDKRLSKERLKRLGNLLEDQMRKENFQVSSDKVVGEVSIINNDVQVTPEGKDLVLLNSIPDSQVPQHILDQYAKVNKTRKKEDKHDAMTDSGVSSETENLDEERSGRTKRLVSQFEKQDQETQAIDTNLQVMNDLCASSETMRLERKNPHLILTNTLKKALKQPLPPGPPPKKPPRLFAVSPIPDNPEKDKRDAKKMLQKLEQVLQKREALNQSTNNVYDIAEEDLSVKKPKEKLPSKEMHYLCTEILDITHRTLLPNQNKDNNCFKLNCAKLTHSTTSLPYTRLSMHESLPCTCKNDDERLSTFINDMKCVKCHVNEEKHGFKCHLNCNCRRSEFYIEKEHIYDEPCISTDNNNVNEKKNNYGTLNSSLKNFSKSLEDLRVTKTMEQNQKIYDIPCDISRPATPEYAPKSDFEKLRRNFENGFTENKVELQIKTDKPALLAPKPNFVKNKFSKSSENLTDDYKNAKRLIETKFGTEGKKSRKSEGAKLTLPKKDNNQLDIDRENLNRLMNEIYDTVTAACKMEDNKPGSFPTEHSDGSTSEESVKLTRSLTEKRKNYVRRVSSRVAYLDQKNIRSQTAKRYRNQTSICSVKSEIIGQKDNPYYTFRSWKSFRTSQVNLNKMADSPDCKKMADSMDYSVESIDNMSIDEKTGCVDIKLPFEPRERGLFNVCMLVGLNYMTGQAYVKSVFPSQVKVPPHIENLVFPETLSWSGQRGEWAADVQAQCYSLVLTDELGERAYGYCRRVLPEGATTCLPLCYCIIGKYRAPGFYYKVLQEIESHHGSSEQEIQTLLQQLIETDFPNPGEIITIARKQTEKHISNLDDVCKSKTMPDLRRSGGRSNDLEESMENMELPKYLDFENNNAKRVTLSFDLNRPKIIKRPIEPRVDEDNLSTLLDTLGAGLVVKIFGSLLLERKVIIISDKLSLLSSCMEALQSALYPLVWQQPLISCIPSEIQRDVLEAPLPILAGMLHDDSVNTQQRPFDEGMLIDLTNPSKVLVYVGDESTILPTACYKTLKTSLQMESIKYKDKSEDSKTRNVLISEAFLRFFVDILGDFWRYFSLGEVKEGGLGKGGVVFDKEAFIKNASSKQNQYFLDWFTETAMFNHFIQNMALCYQPSTSPNTSNLTNTPNSTIWPKIDYNSIKLVDTPLPEFYKLYEERIRNRNNTDSQKNTEKNYKSAVNKKVKLLKSKLRDLIT